MIDPCNAFCSDRSSFEENRVGCFNCIFSVMWLIGPDKEMCTPKIAFISLPINLNISFGCSMRRFF